MKFRRRYPRFTRLPALLLITLGTLALFAGEAAAGTGLHRVGPQNPAAPVGNFPAWYQDNTGLTLEFCDPKNDAELDGAWCLLGRNNVPPGTAGVLSVPEFFPTNFFDEHFYYSTSVVWPASPIKALLWEAAIEAAFSTGGPVPGAQITFARIRVRLQDVPVTGTYRFIHPYGEIIADGVAGGRIFVTEDVGVAPGDFTGALDSNLGPFLLPSNTPGGAEMPPLTATNPTPDSDPAHFPNGVFAPTTYPANGKSYIADPNRQGPVTGSILGPTRNFVRIEGPAGSNLDNNGNTFIETTNFTLVGRIFTDNILSEVTVDRADYARNAAGRKVEVFATGFGTAPARLPAQPIPVPVMPQLSFFAAPCGLSPDNTTYIAPVGATETQMFNAGNSFWAQVLPATIPVEVCVKDNVSLFYFPKTVGDEVTISEAFFDNNANTLSVKAFSGDEVAPPVLTLGGFGNLTNGSILVAPLAAPPSKIRVLSSLGGTNEMQVTTNGAIPPATGVTLQATPGSPQLVGTQVAFIAAGQGGTGIYEYQFSDNVTGTMTVKQAYSASSARTWSTTGVPGGSYAVRVDARSLGSTSLSETDNTITYTLTVPAPATGVLLTPDKPSPQSPGTQVVLFAAGQGGTGVYQYQFSDNTTGPMTVKQPYSTASSRTWNTTGVPNGSYAQKVDVRSLGSASSSEASNTITYVLATSGPATGVLITPDHPSPQFAGNAVQFFANGLGSSGYQYRFWLHDGATWSMVQDYGVGSEWSLPASTPIGSYTLAVDIRTNPAVYRDTVTYLPYQVTATPAPATGVDLIPNQTSPQPVGTAVLFAASGIGSSGYQYRFLLYDGATWSIVQDYGVSNAWILPASTPAGSYTLAVDVRTTAAVVRDAVTYLPYQITP